MDKLRVMARGGSLVLDLVFAQQTHIRRYIGRTAVQAAKVEELPAGEPCHVAPREFLSPGEKPIPHYAFPKNGTVAEIPAPPNEFGKEYCDEIVAGNLWPADQETAAFCKVKFDPTFGGEYPQLTNKPSKGTKTEA
jgi:hypothetical protein